MTIAEEIKTMMAGSSWIRKMFEEGAKLKAQHGPENVYDFSLGNPNLDPPDVFRRYGQCVKYVLLFLLITGSLSALAKEYTENFMVNMKKSERSRSAPLKRVEHTLNLS